MTKPEIIGWVMAPCSEKVLAYARFVYVPLRKDGRHFHMSDETTLPGLPGTTFWAALAEHKLSDFAGLSKHMAECVEQYDCVYTQKELPLA